MFEDRLASFSTHISEDASLSVETRNLTLSLLALFDDAQEYLIEIGDPPNHGVTVSTFGKAVLDHLLSALLEGADEAVLRWVSEAGEDIAGHLIGIQKELSASERQQPEFLVSRARALSQQASSVKDRASLRSATIKLNAELQDSAAKAKDAAGIIGASSLATHFGSYADREVSAANAFRTSALLGFALALAFALALGNGANGFPFAFQSEWAALAFKTTGALGIGGVAAYLARQSGQHRRMANWARSMEVQLQSFPAFIEPLQYEQQAEMYSLLARRVLTAPPEKSGSASDDSVGAAQLLDILTSALKRSSPPGS